MCAEILHALQVKDEPEGVSLKTEVILLLV